MPVIVVVALVVVALIAVAVLVGRSRRSTDDVAGFRRQIDALSSDARRPTIERATPDKPEPPLDPPEDEPDGT